MRLLYYYGTIEKLNGNLMDYVTVNFSREYEFEHNKTNFFNTNNNNELSLIIKRSSDYIPYNFWSNAGKVYNCTVLVGENGSGKTTILQNILSNILRIGRYNREGRRLIVLQIENTIFAIVQIDDKTYYSRGGVIKLISDSFELRIELEQKSIGDISKALNSTRFAFFSNTLSKNDLLYYVYDYLIDKNDKAFDDMILHKRICNCLYNYSITNRVYYRYEDASKTLRSVLSNRFRNEIEFVLSNNAQLIAKQFKDDRGFELPIPNEISIRIGVHSYIPIVDSTGKCWESENLLLDTLYEDGLVNDATFYLAITALLRFAEFMDPEDFEAFNKSVYEKIPHGIDPTRPEMFKKVQKYILGVLKDQLLVRIKKIDIFGISESDIEEGIKNSYDFGVFLYQKKIDLLFQTSVFNWSRDDIPQELVFNANTKDLVKNRKTILEFFDKYNALLLDSEDSFLLFDWGISSGEENILDMLSSLYKISLEKSSFHTLQIYLDEADIGYHPEWQRKWFYLFPQMVEEIFMNSDVRDIQFILATHSPLLLGDIPSRCAKYVKKGNNKKLQVLEYLNNEEGTFETFGQNLYTILRNGFFLEKGAIGEIAIKKSEEIAEVFELLRELGVVLKSEKCETIESLKKLIELDKLNVIYTQNLHNDSYVLKKKRKASIRVLSTLTINDTSIKKKIANGQIEIEYGACLTYAEILINLYSGMIKKQLMNEYMEIVNYIESLSKDNLISVIDEQIKRLTKIRKELVSKND